MRALGIKMAQLWGLVPGETAAVAVVSFVAGAASGLVMAVMFVQTLAPAGQLAMLVLGAMCLAVAIGSRSLGRINPVELLWEAWQW